MADDAARARRLREAGKILVHPYWNSEAKAVAATGRLWFVSMHADDGPKGFHAVAVEADKAERLPDGGLVFWNVGPGGERVHLPPDDCELHPMDGEHLRFEQVNPDDARR